MNYLVYTPFRCGSSYLVRVLERQVDKQANFIENYNKSANASDIIIKAHTEDMTSISELNFDHIFTCIRKPTEIFPSAFFKDMKTGTDVLTQYPYFYNGVVDKTTISDMLDLFISKEWDSYKWLSYDYNFSQLEKLTGIDIWQAEFDKSKGHSSYVTNSGNVHVMTHPFIFQNFEIFQNFFVKNIGFIPRKFDNYSYRNSDKYGDIYQEFIQQIPREFYEKYKHLDDKIINKFMI
jgi:hypothetical protein